MPTASAVKRVPRSGSSAKSWRSVVFEISLECCFSALHAGSSRRDGDGVGMMERLLALEMRLEVRSLDR